MARDAEHAEPNFADAQPAAWLSEPMVGGGAVPLPMGLKVICILAIVLGATGALASVISGVGLLQGPAAQARLNPGPAELPPEARELQERIQAEINAITQRYVTWSLILVIMHLLSAMLLLIGGLLAYQRKEAGRRLLLLACGIATLYVIVDGIVHVRVQLQTIPIARQVLGEMVRESDHAAENPADVDAMADMAPGLMKVFIFVGLAIYAAIMLAKILFYVVSVVYLRRSRVRALFGAESAPAELTWSLGERSVDGDQ